MVLYNSKLLCILTSRGKTHVKVKTSQLASNWDLFAYSLVVLKSNPLSLLFIEENIAVDL